MMINDAANPIVYFLRLRKHTLYFYSPYFIPLKGFDHYSQRLFINDKMGHEYIITKE